jgi:hypothetical protein
MENIIAARVPGIFNTEMYLVNVLRNLGRNSIVKEVGTLSYSL